MALAWHHLHQLQHQPINIFTSVQADWENHSLCWIQCIWWAFSSLVKLVVLFGRLVGRLAGSCTISIPEAGAMYNCTCLRFEGLFAVPVLYQKIQKPIGPRVDWHKWGKVGAPHSECVITSDWFRPPPPLLRLAPTYPPRQPFHFLPHLTFSLLQSICLPCCPKWKIGCTFTIPLLWTGQKWLNRPWIQWIYFFCIKLPKKM